MNHKTNILILLLLLGVAIFAVPSQKACATSTGGGTIAAQTCDTQVWQTMEARARLETEREVMQNQNLIFKPDSILTYTCFDKFAGHASENIGLLFTHTTYFNQHEIIPWGENGMNGAIQKAVVGPMQQYISANFAHSNLGGRGEHVGLGGASAVPALSGRGGSYSCDVMNKVWAVAKCMNFMHTSDFAITDGYYPFKNLVAATGGENVAGYESYVDTRDYPMNSACSGNPFVGSDWVDMNDQSRNKREGTYDRLYQYGTPNNQIFTAVSDRISPFGSGNTGGIHGGGTACSDPVLTGVTVVTSDKSYLDGICTNPGCTYTAGSTGAGTCVATQ